MSGSVSCVGRVSKRSRERLDNRLGRGPGSELAARAFRHRHDDPSVEFDVGRVCALQGTQAHPDVIVVEPCVPLQVANIRKVVGGVESAESRAEDRQVAGRPGLL